MNVLFLTLSDFQSFSQHSIYCDLLREFIKNGHEVYSISPVEKRRNIETHWEDNNHILKLKIGNTQKTNIIEKGISTVMIEPQFKAAIRRYFSDIKFDLILYSTPPITLLSAIKYIKKRDNAKTYLMLKDIFPQNAIDIGMLTTSGIKGLLYRFFRKKEKKLYAISDRIGCMSPANVKYVIDHNPEIDPKIVGLCPNVIDIPDKKELSAEDCKAMREKYGIPTDKKVFIYGGNLGKPQDIEFVIKCLRESKKIDDAFFLIVGSGTEYGKLQAFVESEKPENVKLMSILPKEDYDILVSACDVGLLFLDHRFTIPNFPSRLLSYMQVGLPVMACTDVNTDVGKVITDGGFGWWCESSETENFIECLEKACASDMSAKRINSRNYLENYSVDKGYLSIMNSFLKQGSN